MTDSRFCSRPRTFLAFEVGYAFLSVDNPVLPCSPALITARLFLPARFNLLSFPFSDEAGDLAGAEADSISFSRSAPRHNFCAAPDTLTLLSHRARSVFGRRPLGDYRHSSNADWKEFWIALPQGSFSSR